MRDFLPSRGAVRTNLPMFFRRRPPPSFPTMWPADANKFESELVFDPKPLSMGDSVWQEYPENFFDYYSSFEEFFR